MILLKKKIFKIFKTIKNAELLFITGFALASKPSRTKDNNRRD